MKADEFYAHTRRTDDGCLIWVGAIKSSGYGNLRFNGSTWMAHRVSYHLSNGPIPPSKRVLHSCDVRACVEPKHLRAGTARANSREMVARRRYRGPAKLSPEQRALVIAACESRSQSAVAAEFRVSQTTVSNIVHGKHLALADARYRIAGGTPE